MQFAKYRVGRWLVTVWMLRFPQVKGQIRYSIEQFCLAMGQQLPFLTNSCSVEKDASCCFTCKDHDTLQTRSTTWHAFLWVSCVYDSFWTTSGFFFRSTSQLRIVAILYVSFYSIHLNSYWGLNFQILYIFR
jgi:hypothetical protein